MASTATLGSPNRTATLTAEATVLADVFRTLTATSCPQTYNFHLHTIHSDGRLEPKELIDQAIAIGLQGFAITDHHSVQGYQRAKAYLEQRSEAYCTPSLSPPQLWSGIEITADLGGTEVHLLGFAFDPTSPGLFPYLQGEKPKDLAAQAQQVIATIQEAGGIAVLAHPARYRTPAAKLVTIAAGFGIDGVETYYAYGNPIPWQPSPRETAAICKLAETWGLLSTCGTDSHGLSLLQRL